jgi:hypothetical protein
MTPEMKAADDKARLEYPAYDIAKRLHAKLMLVADDGSWAGSNAPAWRLTLQQICWMAEAIQSERETCAKIAEGAIRASSAVESAPTGSAEQKAIIAETMAQTAKMIANAIRQLHNPSR